MATEAPRIDPALPWWRGAVIYQIYPRSFADSNGDGIGDLPGITRHLDYVASLGVDAIWLSPFFTSPMHDFGYDVADYRDVDPIFGTLDDFDALVARAHALGLKVVIDQVYSHTSDQHPWFEDSRSDRINEHADWYVWADPKPDGSPPNNWQSVFSGAAWTWDARRQQYYLHNFLPEQPQINGHNPAVQDALLATARFWLDRGVDGFRLDAINFLMFDEGLADNPPAPNDGSPRTRPFDYQLHVNNQSHPDVALFTERMRALTDEFPGRFTVAEVGGLHSDAERKAYIRGHDRLDTAYGFEFLYADALTPRLVADALASWPGTEGMGWPSWAFENHDAPRALSRWGGTDARAYAAMKMALLMALRGNVFVYYGEELGLTQVDIAFEDLRDPEAIANWPRTLSRDGARTPMPWVADAPNAGFTTSRPWLPIGPDHGALAVDRQEGDPASLLHKTRALIALRRAHPALRLGALETLTADDAVVSFERVHEGEQLACAFNLTDRATEWRGDKAARVLVAINGATADRLPPFGAIILSRD